MRESELHQGDYITLSSIKKAILDFFRVIFRGFGAIISAIRRSLGWFLLCCLLGIGFSYLYHLLRPKYYQTDMIVYYNDLSRKDYEAIIENLNSLLFTRSYDEVSRELKIGEPEASRIQLIEAVDMYGQSLKGDTSTKLGWPFRIQVKFKEPTPVAPLQTALLHYLNNNNYLKNLKEGEGRVLRDKLQFIEAEQRKLDSLKSLYNSSLATMRMPSSFYNNALNPAEIYVQSNNLQNQKEEILRWFNNRSSAVILIDGFKKPARPHRLPLVFLLAIGLASGVLLGILVALLSAVYRVVGKNSV